MQSPSRPIKKVLRDNDAHVTPICTFTERTRIEWV